MARAAQDSSGASLIIASIILGLSVVTGSFLLKSSVDEGATQLAAVLGEMQEVTAKLAAAPAGKAAAPARPGRPDPNRNYKVALGDAPTKGPKSAQIKIVEWSDFQ